MIWLNLFGKAFGPLKVKAFTWKFILDRVATWDSLRRRNIFTDANELLPKTCGDEPENVTVRLQLMETSNTLANRHKWIQIQESLKENLITEDQIKFKLPTKCNFHDDDDDDGDNRILKYVGGVDLSFSNRDPSTACATLVILDLTTLQVVHEDSSIVKLDVPYVPGFLAFREAPVLLELLQNMKNRSPSFYPQVLMVDGNGLLHPRGFGLACHLGVLANLPTIGIGKNLHHVDGLTHSKVRSMFEAKENSSKDVLTLIGDSASTLGAAMRSSLDSLRPIFVSVGHCISLSTAVEIVRFCCVYRVPEPIRQADIRSKVQLHKHGLR